MDVASEAGSWPTPIQRTPNRRASVGAAAKKDAHNTPSTVESPSRKAMIVELMAEHPGLNEHVASDSVDAALRVMGASGAGGDVVLTAGVTREVSVHTGAFNAFRIGEHLRQEARQEGVREVYMQVNSDPPRPDGSKASRAKLVRQVMEEVQNGFRDLDGVRVRIYDAHGEITWQGNMRFREKSPVVNKGGSPESNSGGGTPPRTPGESLPEHNTPTSTSASTESREVRPVTTADVGTPNQPIAETPPGSNFSKGEAIGGGVQLLQSMLVNGLQDKEVAAYQDRLAVLQPKIDAYLNRGYSVELTLIVDEPNSFDFLSGFSKSQDQIAYFHTLYISRVTAPAPLATAPVVPPVGAQMGPPGGRDSEIPYTSEGGSIIEEREIPSLTPRDTMHHAAFEKHTIEGKPTPSIEMPHHKAPQPDAPEPHHDEATRRAMAIAPAYVILSTTNIVQSRTADALLKALDGNPQFHDVKESLAGGSNGRRTLVLYYSSFDKTRAEALAEIARKAGAPTAVATMEGPGDRDPGYMQVNFGSDSEHKAPDPEHWAEYWKYGRIYGPPDLPGRP